MADALVSIAVEKLTQVMGFQIKLFAGATRELERFKATFMSIKGVLPDAENRQVGKESAQLWLSRLRNVYYDIDDLLNDWLLTFAHDEDEDDNEAMGNFVRDSRPVIRRSQTMTSSYMNEQRIGRDDDRNTVINWLFIGSGSSTGDGEEYGPQQQQQVQVIAIVGIGGLGKTTLARKIYHDSKVQNHFKEGLYWVCLPQDFDVKRLTKAIIEQVKGEGTSLSELDSLQNELVRVLRGKRFFLVLDNVWNDNKRKWNALQPCLAVGALGSRILVTTCLQMVAESTMNASHIHELKGLADNHSWRLFSSIAFDGWTGEEYSGQLES